MMGSLLAIPPGVTVASLGLTTSVGNKLFQALQDYGAYVVHDSSWNVTNLCAEVGVDTQVRRVLGYEMNASSGPLFDDMMHLLRALAEISNNAAGHIGGGGGAPLGN